MTPSDITLEIYPTLKDFRNKNIQNQYDLLKTVHSTLQMSNDSLLTEDQEQLPDSAWGTTPQTETQHWILSPVYSNTPAQWHKNHTKINPKHLT